MSTRPRVRSDLLIVALSDRRRPVAPVRSAHLSRERERGLDSLAACKGCVVRGPWCVVRGAGWIAIRVWLYEDSL